MSLMRTGDARGRAVPIITDADTTATLDGAVDLSADRDLVLRFQAGDDAAFSELYAHYHRRILRLCERRLGRGADADEAVQEAFARAWRALPRLNGERHFYPWLRVIAVNVCADVLRRRSRLVPVATVPEASATRVEAEIDEAVLRQVDVVLASRALANLSERHRRVLRLRESSGWSTQRIAEAEGMAAPAVDVLLWRARQALKREFVALADGSASVPALLGLAAVSLHRLWSRAGGRFQRLSSQCASVLSSPGRGPAGVVVSLALTGSAVAGGAIAIVGSGGPAVPAASAAAGHGPVALALTRTAGSSTAPAPSTAPDTAQTATSGPGAAAPADTGAGPTATAGSGPVSGPGVAPATTGIPSQTPAPAVVDGAGGTAPVGTLPGAVVAPLAAAATTVLSPVQAETSAVGQALAALLPPVPVDTTPGTDADGGAPASSGQPTAGGTPTAPGGSGTPVLGVVGRVLAPSVGAW